MTVRPGEGTPKVRAYDTSATSHAVAVCRHHLVVLGALLPGKRVRADDLLAAQVGPAVQKKVADVGDELGAETLKARVLTVFGVVARGE